MDLFVYHALSVHTRRQLAQQCAPLAYLGPLLVQLALLLSVRVLRAPTFMRVLIQLRPVQTARSDNIVPYRMLSRVSRVQVVHLLILSDQHRVKHVLSIRLIFLDLAAAQVVKPVHITPWGHASPAVLLSYPHMGQRHVLHYVLPELFQAQITRDRVMPVLLVITTVFQGPQLVLPAQPVK